MPVQTNNTNAPGSWSPDQVSSHVFTDVLGDALYNSLTTVVGSIQGDQPSIRVPVVTDSKSADFVPEGATIPEVEPSLDEVVLQTRKIAVTSAISNEQASQGTTPAQIAASLKRDIVRKLDQALLTQAAPGVGEIAPSVGILNTLGIIEGDPLVSDLDPLVDLISQLEANFANPPVLLVDPLAKAALFRLKTDVAASNVGLLSPATSTPTSPILGLQMIVSPFMPANSGLIVDPSNIVSATSTVDVAQSTDARFYEDAVVYRVVTRCGHAVVHADRLAKLSIGVAADD